MRQDEYQACDALELAARVADGELAPEELLETALARMEACNPQLNAIVIPMVGLYWLVSLIPPSYPLRTRQETMERKKCRMVLIPPQ